MILDSETVFRHDGRSRPTTEESRKKMQSIIDNTKTGKRCCECKHHSVPFKVCKECSADMDKYEPIE